MQKKLNIKCLSALLVIFAILILSSSIFSPVFQNSKAENVNSLGILNNSLYVELINRNNSPIDVSSTKTDYSGGTAYIGDWALSKELRVNYIADEDNLPIGIPDSENPEILNYTLTVNVEYLQGYTDTNDFDVKATVLFEDVMKVKTNDYKELEDYVYIFDIDSGIEEKVGTEVKLAYGWGIYRFTFDINGYNYVSDFYVIEPSNILPQPQIQAERIPSQNSMHDSYKFTLVNADDYKYIDQSCLIWYIDGEGIDGTKYCLLQEDVSLADYNETYKPLWDRYNRTGTEFTFNDNEKAGTYQIWCRYKYHNADSSTSSDRKITVKTGTIPDYTYIIYIVIAIAVLSIIITISVAIAKKKKEKVW